MLMSGGDASRGYIYLLREAGLILVWAYVILVAGAVTGLVNFRVQVISATLGVGLLGAWLALRALRRRRIPRAGLESGLLVFLATQLAAALVSPDMRRSLPVVAQYLAYALVFYFAFDLIRSGWPAELFEKTLLVVGGIVVGLALLELAQLYLGWRALAADLGFAPPFAYRLYAVFGDANLLAAFLNLLIPLAAARGLASRSWAARGLISLFIIAAIGVEYFSSSRGGFLGLATASAALCAAWIWFASPEAGERAQRAWAWLRARPSALAFGCLAGLILAAWAGARLLQSGGDATHSPALVARTGFWEAAWLAFKDSPVWGSGPGAYPTDLMLNTSMPPSRPYLHAHSVPFTFAAESGLIGLAGVGFAGVTAARALWRARRGLDFASRARWAGIFAAFAGFSVHSLADNHLRFPAVAIPALVLLSLALTLHPPPSTLSPLWLILPGLALSGFTAYSLRAQWYGELAIDAALADDWTLAAQRFDEAARRDPALAHYWLQGGFAYGMLAANGETDALEAAIERTRRGLALEPRYALNHANLAALYWQAGRREAALAEMRRATDLAPQAGIFWLNAGAYLETVGEGGAAMLDYRAALDADPTLADSAFWAGSPLRAASLAEWQAARPAVGEPAMAAQYAARARREIEAGDLPAAESDLASGWRLDSQNGAVYLGLAELTAVRGRWTDADRYLQVALWLQSQSNVEKVWPLLTWAELARRRGDSDAAIARYRQAFDAVTEYTVYGWGSWGWNPYAWFVFQRRGLPVDVLPQVTRAEFTSALGRRLLPLGELYEARGDRESALMVYRRVLAGDPSSAEARRQIERLSSQ